MTTLDTRDAPVAAGTTAPRAWVHLPDAPAAVLATAALLPGRGVRTPADLLDAGGAPAPWDFDPHALLGRKGVRYKDRATLLALAACAVALDGLAPAADATRSAVVVASCYGNVGTVCDVAAAIERDGTGAISPMDLPNASSNVVAAALAIRFGVTGVCLSVCNGHASGWDALVWAGRLLAAGRADRVLVVGVETPSAAERHVRGTAAAPLLDGAAVALLARPEGDAPTAGRTTRTPAPVAADAEAAGVGGVLDLVAAVAAVGRDGGAVRLDAPGARPGRPAAWTVHGDPS